MSKIVCPNCGSERATSHALPEYRYTESGLDNVILLGGVTETRCPSCDQRFIRIWKEQQLLQVIAMGLLQGSELSGADLRFLRRACGLSQDALATKLKTRRATIAERESKPAPVLGFAEELGVRAILLREFHAHLNQPGNSHLEPSQLEELWRLNGDVQRLMSEVHRERKIRAAVQLDLWTLDPTGS